MKMPSPTDHVSHLATNAPRGTALLALVHVFETSAFIYLSTLNILSFTISYQKTQISHIICV